MRLISNFTVIVSLFSFASTTPTGSRNELEVNSNQASHSRSPTTSPPREEVLRYRCGPIVFLSSQVSDVVSTANIRLLARQNEKNSIDELPYPVVAPQYIRNIFTKAESTKPLLMYPIFQKSIAWEIGMAPGNDRVIFQEGGIVVGVVTMTRDSNGRLVYQDCPKTVVSSNQLNQGRPRRRLKDLLDEEKLIDAPKSMQASPSRGQFSSRRTPSPLGSPQRMTFSSKPGKESQVNRVILVGEIE